MNTNANLIIVRMEFQMNRKKNGIIFQINYKFISFNASKLQHVNNSLLLTTTK